MGYESVRVNGGVASRQYGTLWFVPRFDFTLPAREGAVPAAIEVRVAPWLALTALRLTVAGQVVYSEGRW